MQIQRAVLTDSTLVSAWVINFIVSDGLGTHLLLDHHVDLLVHGHLTFLHVFLLIHLKLLRLLFIQLIGLIHELLLLVHLLGVGLSLHHGRHLLCLIHPLLLVSLDRNVGVDAVVGLLDMRKHLCLFIRKL